VTACPRCGSGVAATQEYCLECGLRLPGPGRLGPPPLQRRRLAAPLIAAAAIAAAGAGVAIAVTWDDSASGRILIATGGSAATAETTKQQAQGKLATWPVGRDGWTIVLLSVPKKEGRAAAVSRAQQAKERGLPTVGLVDSSKVAGLHPGYWAVFSGIYDTKPEATSELLEARNFAKSAATRKLSG
jgi:hypothetical protein